MAHKKINNDKVRARLKRKRAIRKRLSGTAERPRLSVFRSLRHISVQAIDDTNNKVLAAVGDNSKALAEELAGKKKKERARAVGKAIGEKLKALNIEQVAAQLDLSVRMLEYLFRQTLNLSPGAYYRRLRLQIARRMVVDTRLQLREIAIRTGFNSLSSFSRQFRNLYQQFPGECRKQALLTP